MWLVHIRQLINSWQLKFSRFSIEQRVLDFGFVPYRSRNLKHDVENVLLHQTSLNWLFVRVIRKPLVEIPQNFIKHIVVLIHAANSDGFLDQDWFATWFALQTVFCTFYQFFKTGDFLFQMRPLHINIISSGHLGFILLRSVEVHRELLDLRSFFHPAFFFHSHLLILISHQEHLTEGKPVVPCLRVGSFMSSCKNLLLHLVLRLRLLITNFRRFRNNFSLLVLCCDVANYSVLCNGHWWHDTRLDLQSSELLL